MVRRAREVAKVRMLSKLVGIVVRGGRIHHCESGWQSGHNHGWIGRESYFDVGSVSEETIDPRGAGEKICSTHAPNVREGESVDIEIDSGAEVSCLHVNIGADTCPLHETRLSMCGGHRWGWRLLTCEVAL